MTKLDGVLKDRRSGEEKCGCTLQSAELEVIPKDNIVLKGEETERCMMMMTSVPLQQQRKRQRTIAISLSGFGVGLCMYG